MALKSDMTHLMKKFSSSRLTILLHKGEFLIVDPACNRAYPFVYASYHDAHRAMFHITVNGQKLWDCHPTGWLPVSQITLRAMK